MKLDEILTTEEELIKRGCRISNELIKTQYDVRIICY